MFKDFGKLLKELREQKNLSQRELARTADIADSYVGRLEREEVQPTHRVVEKLSSALNVNVNYFIESDKMDEVKILQCLEILQNLYKTGDLEYLESTIRDLDSFSAKLILELMAKIEFYKRGK